VSSGTEVLYSQSEGIIISENALTLMNIKIIPEAIFGRRNGFAHSKYFGYFLKDKFYANCLIGDGFWS